VSVQTFPDFREAQGGVCGWFAQDGSVKSKTKRETGTEVDPEHVAVFESGRLLIIGESGENQHTPYTAVFEASGKLAFFFQLVSNGFKLTSDAS
jgi:hypothetical protein